MPCDAFTSRVVTRVCLIPLKRNPVAEKVALNTKTKALETQLSQALAGL